MATKLQILDLHARYPEMTSGEIADRLGGHAPHVRATLSRARAAERGPVIKIRKKAGTRSTFSKNDVEELIRKRDIERKSWRQISIETGRPLSTCSARYAEEHKPRIYQNYAGTTRPRNIPDEIIADAHRRAIAERSITALLFGDPAPGQSALDKRQAAFA